MVRGNAVTFVWKARAKAKETAASWRHTGSRHGLGPVSGWAARAGTEAKRPEGGDNPRRGGARAHKEGGPAATEGAPPHGGGRPARVRPPPADQDGNQRAGPVARQEKADLRGREAELPPEDDGQVGHDEATEPVDERPGYEQAHGGRKPPEKRQRAREHPRTLADRFAISSRASVPRAQRSVSSDVSRRIHSDATRLGTTSAERSAPHADYGAR